MGPSAPPEPEAPKGPPARLPAEHPGGHPAGPPARPARPVRVARRRALGLTLAALLLVLFAGPLVLGGPIQGAYRRLLEGTLEALPTGWVFLERYDRGWLCSTAGAELALQPRPGGGRHTPLRLRIDSRIEQGPLAWLSASWPPTLALVHSRVVIADPPTGLPPLGLETELKVGGATETRLAMSAGEHAGLDWDYRIRSGGIEGLVRRQAGARGIAIELALPELELSGPRGRVAKLVGIALSADLEAWIGGLFRGQTRIAIAAAELAGADSGDAAPRGGLTVEGLDLTLALVPSAKTMELRLDASAQSLDLGGRPCRVARLGLRLTGLDGEVLGELISGLKTIRSSAVSRAMEGLAGAALLDRLLPQLAAAGPALVLEPLGCETPEGPVAGRLVLGLESGRGVWGPGADAGAWLAALVGEGELGAPEAVAADWLARAGDGPGSPPAWPLARLVEGGWLSARQGRVGLRLGLAGGVLGVNAKSLPLLAHPGPGAR
jgi:hypothetical protein